MDRTNWEYDFHTFDMRDMTGWEAQSDLIGADGWEMISAIICSYPDGQRMVAFYKRPLN